MTLSSEAGKGSTFTVRLPAGAEVSAGDPISSDRGRSTRADCILVIDDDATARELISDHLKADGFSVVTAEGGMEGLKLAKELQPTAITLDVMMPDLDGWSVLAALRQNPELADIPVFMVTIVDEHRRGIALGAAGYLTKPIPRGSGARQYHDRSRATPPIRVSFGRRPRRDRNDRARTCRACQRGAAQAPHPCQKTVVLRAPRGARRQTFRGVERRGSAFACGRRIPGARAPLEKVPSYAYGMAHAVLSATDASSAWRSFRARLLDTNCLAAPSK